MRTPPQKRPLALIIGAASHCGAVILVGPFLVLALGVFNCFSQSTSFQVLMSAYWAAFYALFCFPHNLLLLACCVLSAPVYLLIHTRVDFRLLHIGLGAVVGGLFGAAAVPGFSLIFGTSDPELLGPMILAGLIVGGVASLAWDLSDYCLREIENFRSQVAAPNERR
jgi:hypothetical protein